MVSGIDDHLRKILYDEKDIIEESFNVVVNLDTTECVIEGKRKDLKLVNKYIKTLFNRKNGSSTPKIVFQSSKHTKIHFKPLNHNQELIIDSIDKNDITFVIGPAGTGKTYVSIAQALSYLYENRIDRIILVRPILESGESLGHLPGNVYDKVSPYMRPLADSMLYLLGKDLFDEYIEKDIVEIAPLAYMRGRTLNRSFIVVDEAQNITMKQMKLLLTRFGFDSKMVINGDITQVDLPKYRVSALKVMNDILRDVDGVNFVYLDSEDVIRHRVVRDIINAYNKWELK